MLMSTTVVPSTALLEEFAARLRPRLQGELRLDAMTRALYATDASLYQLMPIGVLLPKHADDVQAAMEEAVRFKLPVVPRGGGSSLAGQAVAEALVIDFTPHLHQVLETNAEEGWARVQPGVTLTALDQALKQQAPAWMVGPDPSSGTRATFGGMAATNATGTHSISYGNMIHHVRAIDAVLSDGTQTRFGLMDDAAWNTWQRQDSREGELYRRIATILDTNAEIIRRDTPAHWRRNSGYRLEYLLDGFTYNGPGNDGGAFRRGHRNVAQVLCGSEGTLAITTALEIGLVPRPSHTVLGVVHFTTRDASLRAVTRLLETDPSAIELFDGVAIDSARKAPGFASRLGFIDGDPQAVLIVEYAGANLDTLNARLRDLQQVVQGIHGCYTVVPVTSAQGISNVWLVRKEGLGLLMGVKGDYKPVAVVEDASVPVEHLADYIEDLDALMRELDTKVVYYAHASAGCLHVRPFFNTKDADHVRKLEAISIGSMELVAKYGGSVSSEHGDGIVRGWLNERFLGTELCDVYRQLKHAFDPDGLLNPGKIVDTPDIKDDLRMGPTYETIPVLEEFDWSEDGGFARAVELCNGNGACRKLHTGTMCPSYMVTREEQDSTRGRANALRMAMSGGLPPEELTSERMYEVMDLCIQCKACKTECPSNVDMAKIKTEWLHKYWAANGLSRRAKLFAEQPQTARRIGGGMKARMANAFNGSALGKQVLKRTLGVSPKRTLPPFAAEPFTKWFAKQRWENDGPTVVLFADTFNNYHHPETARAAAEFLHRTGHRVVVPSDRACCGRPLLSKGMVTEAQALALHTLDILYPFAEQGFPIVGLEPSCILTFSDELRTLLPGDPRAHKLAEATCTFEEFVARRATEGAFADVRWKTTAGKVLLHGHCHQKALVGTEPSVQALALVGLSVEVVDSGCCGMAGSFGYEEEHYDISLAMAERALAPAVRAAAEDTHIAAAGMSCRHQIHDTTGRTARHPAEILRDALE